MLKPNEREFEALATQGYNVIPVRREIAADLETPVSAFLKVARGEYAFLLESVRGGEKWGRYTFLGSEPSMVLRGGAGGWTSCVPDAASRRARSGVHWKGCATRCAVFAPISRPSCRASSAARSAFSPTISCAASSVSPHAQDDLGTPDLYMMFTDTVLMFDNVRQTLKIIANVALEEHPSTRAAYASAAAKIDEMIERLDVPRQGAAARKRREPQRRRSQTRLQRDPRGLHGDGRGGQGIHRGRRHYPGGAVAAFRGAAGEPSV